MRDLLLNGLTQTSPLHILLKDWAPTLITIVIGGLFASVILPRLQGLYTKRIALSSRRLSLAEDIAASLHRYVTCWRRLIQISHHEIAKNGRLTADEIARKDSFVTSRNEARDKLCDLLCAAQLYSTDKTSNLMKGFLFWDEKATALRINELPDISEWRVWEDRIVEQLKKDLDQP